MENRVKFTLTANSYSKGSREYHRGFSIELDENDPRVLEFRGNGCFKEETLNKKRPPLVPSFEKSAPVKDATTLSVDAIEDEKIVALLKDAGYKTLAEVKKDGLSGLMMVDGIGEATAKKILSECKKAIAANKE